MLPTLGWFKKGKIKYSVGTKCSSWYVEWKNFKKFEILWGSPQADEKINFFQNILYFLSFTPIFGQKIKD